MTPGTDVDPEGLIARGVRLLESGQEEHGLRLLASAAELLLLQSAGQSGERARQSVAVAEDLLQLVETWPSGGPAGPAGPLVAIAQTGVTFEDVVGLEEPKEALYQALIRPALNPEGARRWQRKPGGALLLYGPPGTGKTHFAKAVAGELGVPFYELKASMVLSKWLSESEKNIAQVFEQLRQHPQCVLFLDEVEGLLGSREDQNSTVNRVVSEFLAAMDGLAGQPEGVFILAATNFPEKIDPALRRSLRFGKPIYVGLPGQEARLAILRKQLAALPLARELDLPAWAGRLEDYSGADLVALARAAADHAWDREELLGSSTCLQEEDLAWAAGKVRPSCGPGDLQRYEQFRQQSS